MPFIEARDGTPIFYKDWGSGPPIVLIHGWPVNADMWEYQAVRLAESGHRVVAYDRRGFGRSGQPWTGYDYDTLAGDLSSVIETLDLDGITLVGFSMGGGEVARYVGGRGGGRVARAALVSAVTPFLLRTADNETGIDRSVFDQMIAQLESDRPAFLSTFGKQFFSVHALSLSPSSDMLAWMQMLALQASPKATLDCVRAFSETDFRSDLRSFTVPTLIIHGDDDQTVPIGSSGEVTARLLPNAELRVYGGAPHGLFVTHKEELMRDLLAFATGVPVPAS